MDLLRQLFSHLCGQVNCWHAAGVTSVACQRCTGLYVGALLSAIFFFIFRPRPTSRSLWLHGLAMLLVVPFGYHLVSHGTLVRAVTGQLFGYGMAYYLLLVPADRFHLWRCGIPRASQLWYPVALTIATVVILLLAITGRPQCIVALSYLAFAGLIAIAFLISWNVLILATIAWGRLHAGTPVAS